MLQTWLKNKAQIDTRICRNQFLRNPKSKAIETTYIEIIFWGRASKWSQMDQHGTKTDTKRDSKGSQFKTKMEPKATKVRQKLPPITMFRKNRFGDASNTTKG